MVYKCRCGLLDECLAITCRLTLLSAIPHAVFLQQRNPPGFEKAPILPCQFHLSIALHIAVQKITPFFIKSGRVYS